MSLVDLANQKMLPKFQYTDAETCQWIGANNPSYSLDGKHDISSQKALLRDMRIDPAWMLEPKMMNSLHGIRHLTRCAYYSLYLSSVLGLSSRDARNLKVAALLHDIRRENDQGDTVHGHRAAEWLRDNTRTVEAFMNIKLNTGDVEAISTAIELHEIPYEAFTPDQKAKYEMHRTITDALKTLDALDRYRLPKLKWWIDDNHLRIIPPTWLKQVAFDLVLSSEQISLRNRSTTEDFYALITEGRHL